MAEFGERRGQEEASKPSRMAIFMSAFVYPGVGQVMQRRRLMGALYAVVFTALTVALMIVVLRPLFANMEAALKFAEKGNAPEFLPVPIGRVLGLLAGGLLVYALNVADAACAHSRLSRKWNAAQFARRMETQAPCKS